MFASSGMPLRSQKEPQIGVHPSGNDQNGPGDGGSHQGSEFIRSRRILGWVCQIYAVLSFGSMAMMSVGAALLGAALLYTGRSVEGGFLSLARSQRRDPGTWLFTRASAVLFSACALSLIVAIKAPLVIGGHAVEARFAADLYKGWYLFWPILIVAALSILDAKQRNRVFWTWIGAFAVLSAVGVAQRYTGWPRPQLIPNGEGRYHANLFFGHHLSLASIWIFPFFAALDTWAALRRPWIAWAALMGGVTIFFSWSRMVWIALPLGLMAWLVWSLPRRAAIAALVALVIAGAGAWSLPQIRERVTSSMGTSERQHLWQVNLELFGLRPLTGVGWHHNLEAGGWLLQQRLGSTQVFSGHAHNNVLDLLGGTGLVGLGAWLFWWGILVRLAWRVAKLRIGFARGLACAWIVFHLNGLTQVNFWESKVLHQLMWTTAWLLLWNREIGWQAPSHVDAS